VAPKPVPTETCLLLAHLSDAHIGPLPRPRLIELAGKRLTGYLNWTQGRRRAHNMDALNRLVTDLLAQHPDHIAMTGDVLNIGLPAEFPPGRAWLETLGQPWDVSFTPGNHDAYVRGSLPHLAAAFAPFASNDGESHASFPYLRVRGKVALIGLSSAIPTAPFVASGKLGKRQLNELAARLEETRRSRLARIIMIHHPPHRSGSKAGRGLDDCGAFETVVMRYGAELVIHGHNHQRSVAYLDTASGRTPIVGVASASAMPGTHHHRAAYHLFRISPNNGGWHIEGEARGLLPGSLEIGSLGRLPI
jgi:3',5'-cyclic AMP phosphodiesterase CpdA